ncbi:unnamed protein product [Triticum turgidum subsp. durum]|uniref:Uncharacterized protein n=1 Tax=Triticum turgidum subsp. durum TaxID=4567 RepID=A0A9R0R4A4_TRITD|nr:unnamed protein product [Triticum turgidum subsp. durum]
MNLLLGDSPETPLSSRTHTRGSSPNLMDAAPSCHTPVSRSTGQAIIWKRDALQMQSIRYWCSIVLFMTLHMITSMLANMIDSTTCTSNFPAIGSLDSLSIHQIVLYFIFVFPDFN